MWYPAGDGPPARWPRGTERRIRPLEPPRLEPGNLGPGWDAPESADHRSVRRGPSSWQIDPFFDGCSSLAVSPITRHVHRHVVSGQCHCHLAPVGLDAPPGASSPTAWTVPPGGDSDTGLGGHPVVGLSPGLAGVWRRTNQTNASLDARDPETRSGVWRQTQHQREPRPTQKPRHPGQTSRPASLRRAGARRSPDGWIVARTLDTRWSRTSAPR